jgi:hypothetical protein
MQSLQKTYPKESHSRFVPSRPVSCCLVPSCAMSWCLVPSRPVLYRLIPSRLVSSRLISSRVVPSHPVSSRLVSSHHVPSRPVLSKSRPVPSRLVLSRLFLSLLNIRYRSFCQFREFIPLLSRKGSELDLWVKKCLCSQCSAVGLIQLRNALQKDWWL